jgi:hypothetical protein
MKGGVLEYEYFKIEDIVDMIVEGSEEYGFESLEASYKIEFLKNKLMEIKMIVKDAEWMLSGDISEEMFLEDTKDLFTFLGYKGVE